MYHKSQIFFMKIIDDEFYFLSQVTDCVHMYTAFVHELIVASKTYSMRYTHCFQLAVHCVVQGIVLSCSAETELTSEVHLTVYYESDSLSHSFVYSYSHSQSRQIPNSRKTVRNNERIPYSGKFSQEKIFANQCYCPIFVNKNKIFADNIFANSL